MRDPRGRSVYDDAPINGEESEFRGFDEDTPHIDADRTLGPSEWDRECQESGKLNRG